MRDKNQRRNIRLPEQYEAKQGVRRPEARHMARGSAVSREARETSGPARTKRPAKRRPLLRRVLRGLLAVFVLGCVGLGGYLAVATRSDFLWLELEQLPHREATILYAQDRESGEWVEYARLESTQQKLWTPLDEIPTEMQHAFVAIEDKHFYEHHGISVTRTAYAVLNEMKKMLTGSYFGGGIKQGASTIDQQLIKNLTRDDEAGGVAGYLRKVRELWRALCLDAKYDKDQIMEAYLNVISFTDNTAGVGAESVKLFGKPPSELSLAQCASIASITKNPYRYDPRTHPEEHLARRNYILYEMWQQGYITQEQYDAASAQDIGLSPGHVPVAETPTTSYFTDQVLTEVSAALAERYHLDKDETTNLLYNGGLHLHDGRPHAPGRDGAGDGRGLRQLFPYARAGRGDAGDKVQRRRLDRPRCGRQPREGGRDRDAAGRDGERRLRRQPARDGGRHRGKARQPRAEPRRRAAPGGQHDEAHRRVCAGVGEK